MLRDAAFVARTELASTLRQREAIVWILVMPILFFYFIGTVTGGFGRGGGSAKSPLALHAGEDGGFLLGELEKRLGERGFAVRHPDDPNFADTKRRLEVPANLTSGVLAGTPAKLAYHGSREGLDGDYDALRVQRAAYTVLADLVAAAETSGEKPGPEDFAALARHPRALVLASTSAGKRVEPPVGFEQTIPGTMTMFTLIVLLTTGAVRLSIERREGQLRRLASTPIRRSDIVLGKWAGRLGLGLVQIAVAMVAGALFFKISWGQSFPMVCVVMLAWASLAASLSLVLGTLARTDGQAIAVGVLASNVLAALGGCWWPIEVTPPWMQKLALCLPTGWTMDALHKLVSFGEGWASAVPHVVVLSAAAIASGWLAAKLFRFQ